MSISFFFSRSYNRCYFHSLRFEYPFFLSSIQSKSIDIYLSFGKKKISPNLFVARMECSFFSIEIDLFVFAVWICWRRIFSYHNDMYFQFDWKCRRLFKIFFFTVGRSFGLSNRRIQMRLNPHTSVWPMEFISRGKTKRFKCMSYNSNYLRVEMIILISINIKIGDNRRAFWEFNSVSVLWSSLIIALIGLYYRNVIVFCDCVDVYSKGYKKDEFQQIVQLCCSWCLCLFSGTIPRNFRSGTNGPKENERVP